MQLYILGKNTDDKGKQLEQLTVRILEYQGFENIQTNIQGTGGNEIDVTAYKTISAGMKPQNIKLVAECKAYNKPIDMNDWFKFKAKVYSSKEKTPHTIGMMVCLSGANGPVVGEYNENHTHDETIQLIANSDLVKLLSDCYNIEFETKVRERLVAFSYGDIYDINLLYYDKHIYWATSFMDGKFTLSQANGLPMTKTEAETLFPFIANYSPYISEKFIDIRDFYEVQQHLITLNLVLLSILVNGFEGSIKILSKQIKDIRKNDAVDIDVLEMAITQNPFVSYDKTRNVVKLKTEAEIDYIDFYRYVVYRGCPIDLITSEYYQSHINEGLLDKILDIQFGIELPNDKKEDCLFLIKHSPSALLYALTPNQFFKGYKSAKEHKHLRNLYVAFFMKMLTDGFIRNFQEQSLGDMYFRFFKVTQMKVSSEVKVTINDKERCFPACSNWGLHEMQGTNQVLLCEEIPK